MVLVSMSALNAKTSQLPQTSTPPAKVASPAGFLQIPHAVQCPDCGALLIAAEASSYCRECGWQPFDLGGDEPYQHNLL